MGRVEGGAGDGEVHVDVDVEGDEVQTLRSNARLGDDGSVPDSVSEPVAPSLSIKLILLPGRAETIVIATRPRRCQILLSDAIFPPLFTPGANNTIHILKSSRQLEALRHRGATTIRIISLLLIWACLRKRLQRVSESRRSSGTHTVSRMPFPIPFVPLMLETPYFRIGYIYTCITTEL